MVGICGVDCNNCGYGKNNNCKGCASTKGCPFGKQCFIAKYILTGGKENYEIFGKNTFSHFHTLFYTYY